MLVKVIDHKGKTRWLNAAYVKSVSPKGEMQTEIEISGWATKVRVDGHADDVASAINAAMPDAVSSMLAAIDGDKQANDAAQAAAVGAVIG